MGSRDEIIAQNRWLRRIEKKSVKKIKSDQQKSPTHYVERWSDQYIRMKLYESIHKGDAFRMQQMQE